MKIRLYLQNSQLFLADGLVSASLRSWYQAVSCFPQPCLLHISLAH